MRTVLQQFHIRPRGAGDVPQLGSGEVERRLLDDVPTYITTYANFD